MQRKLCKCGCCGQWFNTSQEIMIEHYRAAHPARFQEAVDLAAAAVSSIYKRISPLTTFP